MYSAGKERAKSANTDFLVARMRARKNKVLPWLESMYNKKRESIVTWAIRTARQKRVANRKKLTEVQMEIQRRLAGKEQKRRDRSRREIEKQLQQTDIANLKSVFPDLSEDRHAALTGILEGTVVGRNNCHTRYNQETSESTVWPGKIEKLKKQKLYSLL